MDVYMTEERRAMLLNGRSCDYEKGLEYRL